jgi:hypothetical protein
VTPAKALAELRKCKIVRDGSYWVIRHPPTGELVYEQWVDDPDHGRIMGPIRWKSKRDALAAYRRIEATFQARIAREQFA